MGHLRLTNALSEFYSPKLNRKIDPMKEILVTMGATEALYVSITALINPGDEVLLIEPFYDTYPINTVLAGGVPRFVPLRFQSNGKDSAGSYHLDLKELESLINEKTKVLIINTPQNIPGKVYTKQELESIAELAKKHNLYVISDEVYEPMVYDDSVHLSIASLPGMADRTITIGSAGKSFSVTGWKTGWVIASPTLTEALWMVHQNVAFSGNTPAQEAIAVGFEKINSGEQKDYFKNMAEEFKGRRDLLCQLLKDAGLRPIVPEGSYFVLADYSSVDKSLYFKEDDSKSQDYQFARWLLTDIGVAAIPPSVFYSKEHSHLVENLTRFCFCKKEETIREAGKRLLKLNELRENKPK
eukprot:TRINITY_DN1169_c0_g1_i1.p1 TRINITY_DN1169_c0_g1~~TRINITY_DN1169_c0_g1_i1.p1  ORF type:complete len:356 (-),score=120.21 TRINITY_DN1169_c0_g1_i1:13-1080(-)